MVHQVKHPAHHVKKPASQAFQAVQQAEEKIVAIEREGMQKLMKATGTINEAASECMAACSDNLSAAVESGNKAVSAAQTMGAEIMDYYNRAFADLSQLSQSALACRSPVDVIELHNKAIQQASDNYFRTVNALSGMWFDFATRAMAPFGDRAASLTQHLRKMMPA